MEMGVLLTTPLHWVCRVLLLLKWLLVFLSFNHSFYYINAFGCFVWIYACIPHTGLVSTESRRWHQILYIWSYKYEPPCVLGIELRSLDASVPSLRAISSTPWLAFLDEPGQHIHPTRRLRNKLSEVAAVITAEALSFSYGGIPDIFLCCISEKSSFWIDGTSRLHIVELKSPNQYCFVFFFSDTYAQL